MQELYRGDEGVGVMGILNLAAVLGFSESERRGNDDKKIFGRCDFSMDSFIDKTKK